MKTRTSKVLACLFAGILTATAADGSVFAEDDQVSIVVVPNTIEYKKDDYSYLDEYGTDKPVLTFYAARNERESGQIMLYSTKNISQIGVTMENLTNVLDETQVIPAKNIEVFYEQYVDVDDSEYWLEDMEGFHADPLLPDDIACDDAVKLNRLDTAHGKNQGIWFTLTVPKNAEAGLYSGTCIVTLDGKEKTVPVELTVYDFTLPDQTYFKTHFNDFNSSVEAVYHDLAGYGKEWSPVAQSDDYASDLNRFLNVRKHSTGYPDTGVPWNIQGTSTKEQMEVYADAVYQYVTTSKAPYYMLDATYTEELRNDIFDHFDFDLTDDYTKLYDDANAVSLAISGKYDGIAAAYKEKLGRDLTKDETDALEFAVKTFLYYDVMYFTHTLSADLQGYIVDGNHDKDYWRSHYDKKNEIEITEKDANGKETTVKKQIGITNEFSEPKDWVDRLYDGLMLANSTAALELARPLANTVRYCQYDWVDKDNVQKFGMQTVFQALADKSIATKTDLFRNAYMYCPRIDESQPTDFWRDYAVLAASKVIENSKEAVKEYIRAQNCEPGFQAQLLESLENICYLPTVSPITEPKIMFTSGMFRTKEAPAYLSILFHGLQHLGLGKFSEDYYQFTAYQNGYGNGAAEPVVLEIPAGYTVDCFCPLFNDFSDTETPKCAWEAVAKDYNAVQDALNDPDTHLWWYSCNMSNGNPALASYYIGGNIHHASEYETIEINGNSLAIARANRWQQYVLGIEGELLWAVDNYMYYNGVTEKNEPNTAVWTEPAKSCMCGILVYPIYSLLVHSLGKDDAEAQALISKGNDRFASSIRLENLSEAADDYDYLRLAEQLVESKPDHPEYRDRLNGIIQTVIEPENVDYDSALTNSANLSRARSLLAAFIEGRFSNIKEVTNDGVNNAFRSTTDGVPVVKKWHTSSKVLCFDVCETNTYQNSNGKRKATISLATSDWHRLNDLITIDFEARTINNCPGAALVPKGNGWYTVQIPLNNVKLNLDPNEAKGPANGDETLAMVFFDQRYVYRSFLVDNFRTVKEVTNNGVNNAFTAVADGVPVVKKWHTSNKVLCFDVYETDTYQNSNGKRKATISLATSDWHRLNDLMAIDFEAEKITNCPGAALVPKGDGWYTVQIPLNNVKLNLDPNEAKGPATGDETLAMVFFDYRYVYRSFLADNFRVLKEVTNDGVNNTFRATTDGVPVIDKWKYSNVALCFDVCETDTYQNSNGKRKATISLATSDWHRLNDLMTIDFETKTISNCKDAVMVPKGNGWYTVQIPLKNVELNLSTNEAKGPANGSETLSMVHFKKDYVYRSFLVDNFRLETAVGNGDLNGDGKPDKKDVTEFGDYIMKNGAPPQNAWEADLDHNGVLNAVDLTRLKRMIMEQ